MTGRSTSHFGISSHLMKIKISNFRSISTTSHSLGIANMIESNCQKLSNPSMVRPTTKMNSVVRSKMGLYQSNTYFDAQNVICNQTKIPLK